MKKKKMFSYLFMAIVFVALIAVLWFRFEYLLDSDMSSELILSKLLAEENAVLKTNWYYSTELRALNTQLIYSFFFKLFDNWIVVRTASVIAMYLLLLLVFWYFTKQYHCNEWFGFVGALLVMPISQTYFDTVLLGAYYIPHILISILSLALLEHYYNTKWKWLVVLNCCLAFVAGLGGLRQLVILYAPLGITCIVMVVSEIFDAVNTSEEKKKTIFEHIGVYGSICFSSLIGYVVNSKVLTAYYDFHLYSGINTDREWKNFAFSNIEMYLGGLLNCFGFPSGKMSVWGVAAVVASYGWLAWTAYVLFKELKNKETEKRTWRFSVFVCCGYGVLFLIYFLTDMGYLDRYLLPITVLSIPMMAIQLRKNKQNGNIKLKVISIALLLLTFAYIPGKYIEIVNVDKTNYLRLIEEHLSDNGIVNGYATFWSGNVLTELSNGEIDVWVWADNVGEMESLGDIEQSRKWLQLKSHDANNPIGKVFILMETDKYHEVPDKEVLDAIPYWDVGGAFYLWEFESHEDMVQKLGIG